MNRSDPESNRPTDRSAPEPVDEAVVDLLHAAGCDDVTELTSEQLARIRAAARLRWKAVVEHRRGEGSESTEGPSAVGPAPGPTIGDNVIRGRFGGATGRTWWSLIAAAGIVAVTLGIWSTVGTPATPAAVASVRSLHGNVQLAGDGQTVLVATSEIRSGDTLVTPADGGVWLDVAAGGQLRIGPASRVRLRADGRQLDLVRGQVFIDNETVGPSGTVPGAWSITTPLATLVDIGTRFLVSHDPASELSAVRVLTGEVSLSTLAGEPSTDLRAGDEATVRADGEVSVAATGAGLDALRWLGGFDLGGFQLDGANLADYLDWLALQTGLEIVFDRPQARSIQLSGGSTQGVHPLDTIDFVLPAAGMDHRFDDRSRLRVE